MKHNRLKTRRTAAGKRNSRQLALEWLEERKLLSNTMQPRIVYMPITAATVDPTPAQMQGAYGVNNVHVGSIVGTGAGQTIAIIDAYNENSTLTQAAVYSDLQGFDANFGLADPPSFQVLNQTGGTTLPSFNSGWAGEEALDMEWAHVMAPQANIILFEANSAGGNDLVTAVNTARNYPGVSVVSMSFGGGDSTNQDPDYTTPTGHIGVTFLAATGDSGGASGYPANSPNVIAVGGTSLYTNGNNYSSESAWSGSCGGQDTNENEPSYQRGVQSSGYRETPDVASDADPGTGVSIYVNGALSSGYLTGGTSLATPCWAGVIAIVDQVRVSLGASTLDGATQTLPMLYALPESTDFHDITTGSNSLNSAGPGYDLVTGLGSPVANLLVPALAPYSDLTVAMSDSGSFPQGGAGNFSVTVGNAGAVATSGTVSVADTLPTGLTPTAADTGTVNGWTLSTHGQTVTATRSDALAVGGSYPALTIAVTVAANAPASITNTATVSGGGEVNSANDTATDTITTFALPSVASVVPSFGPSSGGTFVMITGTNLLNVAAVNFGGTPGTILVDTANQIIAASPAGTAGSLDVTVVTHGASSATSAGDQFTYLTAPAVTAVSTTSPVNSTYTVGATISISVTFNEPVYVGPGGSGPQLALNDGGVANYSSGSGTPTLTFTYVVASGQSSSDLDYASTSALTLNSGSIQDAGNEAAGLTLPATGTDGLATTGIVINTTPMAVPASAWAAPGLTLSLDSSGNVNVDVTGTTTEAVAPRTAAGVPLVEVTAPSDYASDLTIDASNGNPIPDGSLNYSGAGGLLKIGSGSALLSGTNTYTGGTTVLLGTLIAGNSEALPGGSNLIVGANGDSPFTAPSTTVAAPMITSSSPVVQPSPAIAAALPSNAVPSNVVPKTAVNSGGNSTVLSANRTTIIPSGGCGLPNAVHAALLRGFGPHIVAASPHTWWPTSSSPEKDPSLHAVDAVLAEYGTR
jgi:autotransporter-associated beta strand protein